MMKFRKYRTMLFGSLAVIAFGAGGGKASAQAWIGQIVGNMMANAQAAQQEQNCMTGTPMPDSEIAETRATAQASITGYWQAVQSGQNANVAKFFSTGKKTQWVSGKNIIGLAGLNKVQDPFGSPGAVLDQTPLAYFRSGDGGTVHGQWRVRRADGALLGTYDAAFKRTGGTWLLSDLQLLSSAEPVYPLVQYCHKRDDVLPYRLTLTENGRTYTERRAVKMSAKAEKAKAEAEKATTAVDAAKPSNKASKSELATQAADKSQKAYAKANEARNFAIQAAEANELAKKDAAAMEAARTAARIAVGLS